MSAFNILFDVGSRDEQPGSTGIAHLTEHLMFTGSTNAPHFDTELQRVGGESNAWTNTDMTNYYCVLPAVNIETAFWLESDRMAGLTLSDTSIETQRSVVIEEFKQRCLNTPYGDTAHLVCPLAYHVHPYRWPAIGESVADIEHVSADTLRAFHAKYYNVSNAILCVSGNVEFDDVVAMAERWFGDIPATAMTPRVLPQEPVQTAPRQLEATRDVPADLLVRVYHMPGYGDSRFYACDILSDLLGNGNSSRFFTRLVGKQRYFAELEAMVGGTPDPGLFQIKGKLLDGVDWDKAERALDEVLHELIETTPAQREVDKYINKSLSATAFELVNNTTLATRLCQHELLGNADDINTEADRYRSVTPERVCDVAAQVLTPTNCSTLRYHARRQ